MTHAVVGFGVTVTTGGRQRDLMPGGCTGQV